MIDDGASNAMGPQMQVGLIGWLMMQKLVLDVCKNARQSALLSIADKALLNWDLEIYELQILIGIVVKLKIWLLIGCVSKLE